MTTTQQDIKKMVRAYTEINRPQPVSVIAHALDLTVAEVQHALGALEQENGDRVHDCGNAAECWC